MILRLLILLLIASFILRTVRNLLFQSYLWQIKEYRLDRIFSFLRTSQGRKMIFSPLSLIKWILIIVGLSVVVYAYVVFGSIENYGLIILFLYLSFWCLWVLEGIKAVWILAARGWKLPIFTLKIGLILITVSVIIFGWFYIEDLGFFLTYGPVLDKLLTPTVFIIVIVFNLISWLIKKLIIFLAKRKIGMMKGLTVIGITGSYGKTSTKEFLYTILSEKFKVIKTEGYNNTEIAVAMTILKKLKSLHEIFIVEMGAYKMGEIKSICNIVSPQIGIITGINQQHVELFGSIENTIEAKFELIAGLKKQGQVIFNLNNKYTQRMYKRAKIERKDLNCFGYDENISYSVKNVTKDAIIFELIYKNNKIKCQSNLFGRQNIENVVASCFAALQLGFTLQEIATAVSKLKPPVHTMRLFYNKDKNPLVDDTFNSNPDGVLAALEYLSLYKQSKYLVMTPLIELGKESKNIHELIGEKAAIVCDRVYLTNPNYYNSFASGWKKRRLESEIGFINNSKLPDNGVVLFEGKEAGKILEKYV